MSHLAITPNEALIRTWLGGMAVAELVTRETRYPKLVEQGKMTRDAAMADIAAWRVIAILFAEGSAEISGLVRQSPPGGGGWAELVHAAGIQFQALCRSCDTDPTNAEKRERRDAVQAILSRLEWQRERAMAGQGACPPEHLAQAGRAAA